MFTPFGAVGYDEGNRGFGLCPNPRLIEDATGSAGSRRHTKARSIRMIIAVIIFTIILSLLERSQILRLLYYQAERNPKSMAKPQKVIFDNPSIIYALGYGDKGKIRETFLASMISSSHEVAYPKAGDLLVDNRYLFEVGGVNKGFNQIKDMPDSFVAADDIEQGFGNRIPLWLFGFLY